MSRALWLLLGAEACCWLYGDAAVLLLDQQGMGSSRRARYKVTSTGTANIKGQPTAQPNV
jgi:hypothetical protein